MGILNIFKSKDSSQDIPPPPPLEGLPSFPTPEEISSEKKVPKKPSMKATRMEFEPLPDTSSLDVAEREADRLHRIETSGPTKPIFIGLEEYREVVDELTQLKLSLDDSLELVGRLEGLKHTEDGLFDKWKKQIKDVHNKLIFVDHNLFEKK